MEVPEIAAANATGLDPDNDFICSRLRIGNLLNL
jgi:hypothetical protein